MVITAGSFDLLAEVVCESDEHLLELALRADPRRSTGVVSHRDVHVPPAAQADLLVGRALSRDAGLSLWHASAGGRLDAAAGARR